MFDRKYGRPFFRRLLINVGSYIRLAVYTTGRTLMRGHRKNRQAASVYLGACCGSRKVPFMTGFVNHFYPYGSDQVRCTKRILAWTTERESSALQKEDRFRQVFKVKRFNQTVQNNRQLRSSLATETPSSRSPALLSMGRYLSPIYGKPILTTELAI